MHGCVHLTDKKGLGQEDDPQLFGDRQYRTLVSVAQERSAQERSAQERSAQERSAQNGAPKKGAPKNGAPKNGAPKNGAPKNGAPKNGAPKNGAPKNGAPKNKQARISPGTAYGYTHSDSTVHRRVNGKKGTA